MKKIKEKASKFLDLKDINKATEAAIYYGFLPIQTPKIEKEDKDKVKDLKDGEPIENIGSNENIKNTAEERIAMLRTYTNTEMATMPQPVMLTYNGFINENKEKNTSKQCKIGLEILGSNKNISEAIIIKTALAILDDNGFKNLFVEINSLGDKESGNRFLRELTSYYRKNLNSLPAHCRQEFKKDPFLVINCHNEKCSTLKNEAPKSIACLSDESREYFRGVLEYLESLNINYRINDNLISDRRYTSGTIFEIKQKSENPKASDISLAVGFRSDLLCKKLGIKKEIPVISAKINFKIDLVKKQPPKIKKTSVFFIQLGDEAKHKSLEVIDILRKENIYINHSLGRDKLGGQMTTAERLKVPYILILGKMEAMNNSIIVRETATRAQKTVPINELASHLKKLVK